MKLTLGFSPCPNDTFIFDALVNKRIDTADLEFDVILADVETLNQLALKNSLDISKISFGVLPAVINNYVVLNSGSALGTGVGPILIANTAVPKEEIKNYPVAIPGEHTTAHMLFTLAYPEAKNKVFLRYDEIEDFVLLSKDKTAAGVIIHENRFTYQDKGLFKINDLGEFWEMETNLPIPLGGIVAKRNIAEQLLREIERLIRKSIEYSFSNYPVVTDYVRNHAQEMQEDIILKHIDLYVNHYSINLQEKGKNAIHEMLKVDQNLYKKRFQEANNIFLADEN